MKRIKDMWKRSLAMGLTAVLLTGSIPQAVFAVESAEPDVSVALDEEVPAEDVVESADTYELSVSADEKAIDDNVPEADITQDVAEDEDLRAMEDDINVTEDAPSGDEDTSAVSKLGMGSLKQYDEVWLGKAWAANNTTPTDPESWIILSTVSDNTMHVSDTDQVLFLSKFPYDKINFTDNNTNQWAGSVAKQWCTDKIDRYFSALEKADISTTSVTDANDYSYRTPGNDAFGPASLNNEKLFFLSAEEAYSYLNTNALRICRGSAGDITDWWIRSPYIGNTTQGGRIGTDGKIIKTSTTISGALYRPNARPAFNIDDAAVVYASAATGGKPEADGSIAHFPENTTGEWKLTLIDSNRTITLSDISKTAAPGGTIELRYSGASTGDNEYISAIICDSDDAILGYGSVPVASSGDGAASFTLPADITPGNYTLKVFNEERNGDKESDYSSVVKDLELNIVDDKDLACAEVSGIKYVYSYTGSVIEPDYSVRSAEGTLLVKDRDYTASISPSVVKDMDDYVLTLTGKGSYKGTKTVNFRVLDKNSGINAAASGNKIWFGHDEPIEWRVLSPAGDRTLPVSDADHILLLAEKTNKGASDGIYFDTATNKWAGSKAQEWCTDYYNSDSKWSSSSAERAAISPTNAKETGYTYVGDINKSFGSVSLSNEHFFFLSAREVMTFLPEAQDRKAYRTSDSSSGQNWWLRSPQVDSQNVGYIGTDGGFSTRTVGSSAKADARPTFNLDTSRVLMASAATDGKRGVNEVLTTLSENTTGEWKLTLMDPSRTGFTVSKEEKLLPKGGTVELTYSGARVASNEYISALLFDNAGVMCGYGSVPVEAATGTVSFRLPADIPAGSYEMQVFNEQRNEDKKSDYAGNTVPVTVKVGSEAEVEVNGGDKEVTYGEEITITATAAKPGEGTGIYKWSSDDPDIAEIDPDTGKVTAKKVGSTTIRVIYASETTLGETSIQLTVKKKTLSLRWKDTHFVYDKESHKPTASIVETVSENECSVTVSGDRIEAGAGYVATAELTGSGAGNYAISDESKSCTFSIDKASLAGAVVELAPGNAYNGEEKTQEVLSVKVGGVDMLDQCIVSDNTGTDAGDYTLKITAREDGNCYGYCTADFYIKRKQVVPVVQISGNYTYTGEPIEPEFSVYYMKGSEKVYLSDDDYRFFYSDNIEAGKGHLHILESFESNYYVAATMVIFDILPATWEGETTFNITRNYPYGEEAADVISLWDYLPSDSGELDCTVSVNDINKYVEDREPNPDDKYSTVPYILEADTVSDTIRIKVTTQNYSNEFNITVNIGRTPLGLYEKARNENVLRTKKDITVGKSFTLKPVFLEDGIDNKKVVWTSSNPDAATVDQNGKVTARAAGYTLVSAISEYDPEHVYTQCSVNVTNPVTAVFLNGSSYSLGQGEGVMLYAYTFPSDEDVKFEWSCNNENVNITKIQNDTVSVNGIKPGKAVVTVMAKDGTGKKASCKITVGKPVTGFSVAAKGNAKAVAVGKNLQIKVNWGAEKPANTGVIWSVCEYGSFDPTYDAAISEKGVLKGFSEGRVRVVATSLADGSKQGYTDIDVYVPIKSVALNRKSGTVSMGKDANDLKLSVAVTPAVADMKATGEEIGSEPSVTWSIDNKYAGSLSVNTATGEVKAGSVARKNIPVKATVKGYGYTKTLTCKVTVKKTCPLKGIKISKKSLSIGENYQAKLTATLDPINPDGDDGIIWESSDTDVLAVVGNGSEVRLEAKRPGTAVVTARAAGTVIKKGKTLNPSASCRVTVLPSITGIKINNAKQLEEMGLGRGKIYKLKTDLTLSGSGKASKGLIWKSSNPYVATVSKKGVVKAIAPGYVEITVTASEERAYGKMPSQTVRFSVKPLTTRIILDKTKLSLGTQKGTEYGSIIPFILPKKPLMEADDRIKWTASNDIVSLAILNEKGNAYSAPGESVIADEDVDGDNNNLAIRALKPGVVKITGTALDGSKKKASCTVTIRGEVTGLKLKTSAGKRGVNDVTLSDNSVSGNIVYTGNMKAGSNMTLKPVVDINGVSGDSKTNKEKKLYKSYKKYTDTGVSYRSSDTSVATVDKKGKITVNKKAAEGATASIYVTTVDGRQKAQFKIRVIK